MKDGVMPSKHFHSDVNNDCYNNNDNIIQLAVRTVTAWCVMEK